ncbi:hypothetical protein HDE_00539 [Halotydeus destructor]|nr:hypothetical protein HDE_00539 [Halotydeus destructor]
MNITIQFLAAISLTSCGLCDVSYRSACGVPAVPPSATIHDIGQRLEGAEIIYKCETYLNYLHKMVCRNGTWEGPSIRCGQSIDNDVVKVDIYDQLRNTTIEVSQAPNDNEFKIAYRGASATRVSNENLTSGAIYRWTVHLNLSMDIGFIRVDLAPPPGSEPLFDIVDVYVDPSKVCRQTGRRLVEDGFSFQNNVTGNRTDFWFECDFIDGTEAGVASQSFAFKTNSSAPLTVDLAGVFVAMPVYTCGKPERPPYLNIPIYVENEYTELESFFELDCAKGFMENSTELLCDQNGLWKGSYPECKPLSVCEPLETKALKVEYSDTVHHNGETYLVDQSSVTVTCHEKGPSLFTKCRDGSWETDISCETGSVRKSQLNVVTICLSAIVLICIGAVVSMVIYTRKISADKGPAGVLERSQGSSKKMNHYDSIRYSDIRTSEDYVDVRIYDVAQDGDYEEAASVNLYDDAV